MQKWFLADKNYLATLNKSHFNPSLVLFLIRGGYAYDWNSLCNNLGMSPDYTTNSHVALMRCLTNLKELDFIDFNKEATEYNHPSSKITEKIHFTGKWDVIQQKMGINLAELSALTYDSIVVNPIFKLPDKLKEAIDILVLMPFKEKYKPIYDNHIKNVANELNMSVNRADDFFSSSKIMDDLWSAIFSSKILIADCTERNPNVFYEIGIAHTLGKKVILITQASEDIPFDVNHLRYILYEYTPRGMRDFEKNLKKTIDNEVNSSITRG